MSVSSALSDYFLLLPSNSSLSVVTCYSFRLSTLIFSAFAVTNILVLLPLFTLVFYLGYWRWRQQRSANPAAATSHSDLFTFHLLAMETVTVSGALFFCFGELVGFTDLKEYGLEVFAKTWCDRIHFHTLTCVERYLAVVRPVTYLNLKSKTGVWIRNTCVCCVWLQCFLRTATASLVDAWVSGVLYFSSLTSSLVVVCFCSLSVLFALRRSRPGDVGGARARVDRMKHRAFRTIITITAVLFLCLGGMLVCNVVEALLLLRQRVGCTVMASAVWFSLPSSLVLPLLFLHRAGKLPTCRS